jgi:hypothetical protein
VTKISVWLVLIRHLVFGKSINSSKSNCVNELKTHYYSYGEMSFGTSRQAEDSIYRNGYQQSSKCKKSKEGIEGDQGGHLIGSRFDGAGEQINLVPMKSGVNLSAWKSMENTWADALQQAKKVSVDIRPIYHNGSKRPVAFEVRANIDGTNLPL